MRARGLIESVIYFVNASGHILLAPYSEMATPDGYRRESANTLADVDKLQILLVTQARREWEREALHEEEVFGKRLDEVRDRLYARMTSNSTPVFEKDFLKLYLQLRIDKREKHRQRFREREAYLWARENDSPGRDVAKEEFNSDRHEVKS